MSNPQDNAREATTPTEHEHGSARRDPDIDPEDVLEAFNAEGVIEHPGRPEADAPKDPDELASRADVPPPG